MNKQELLDDMASKQWIDEVVNEPELQETKPNGDKWYFVNVREVVGNVAIYKNVHFYVIAEGKNKEVAYYKDQEPIVTIALNKLTG